MSVPMTLSDLERRDAMGIFHGLSLMTLVPFDQIRHRWLVLGVSHAPTPRGGRGRSAP